MIQYSFKIQGRQIQLQATDRYICHHCTPGPHQNTEMAITQCSPSLSTTAVTTCCSPPCTIEERVPGSCAQHGEWQEGGTVRGGEGKEWSRNHDWQNRRRQEKVHFPAAATWMTQRSAKCKRQRGALWGVRHIALLARTIRPAPSCSLLPMCCARKHINKIVDVTN